MKIKSIAVLVVATLMTIFAAGTAMATDDEVNLSAFAQSANASGDSEDPDFNGNQTPDDSLGTPRDKALPDNSSSQNDNDDISPDTATGDDY